MSERESVSALASLGGPVAMPDAEVVERQHQRVLPELRRFVRGIPARRRRRHLQRRALQGAGVLLSAAVAIALWLRPSADRAAYVVEQGHTLASTRASECATSDFESATLRTRGGTRVFVGVATRIEAITADAQHEEVRLAGGSVELVVPKLAPGQSFSVQTSDAKVTVHGTVFSVKVSGEGAKSQTCVSVTQGLVSVERAGRVTFLKGGEQSNCSAELARLPLAQAEPVARAVSPLPIPSEGSRPSARVAGPHSAPGPGPSSPAAVRAHDAALAAQNALLSDALQAERAGRYVEARSRLVQLLRQYPNSALRLDAERSLERVSRQHP